MMCYYLLRNNKESGPFTLKELRELPLLTTDLIWINGESSSWQSPDEIAELAGVAREPAKTPRETKPEKPPVTYSAATASPAEETTAPKEIPDSEKLSAQTPLSEPSFEELKKKYAAQSPRRKVWKTQVSIGANLMGIVILLIGISLAAFMLKKAVDNIEQEPITATAEAREIGATAAYVSSSNQAAKAALPAVTIDEDEEAEAAIKPLAEKVETTKPVEIEPSLPDVSESVKTPPLTSKEERKDANRTPAPKPEREKEKPVQEESTPSVDPADTAAEKSGDEKKADEKKKTRPKIQLSASEYKVGFLGGISNLELSVSNPSAEKISRAVIEVEYLKPNGKVVGTQRVEVSDLGPDATKKISVPDHGRGVSVRYHVVTAEMK